MASEILSDQELAEITSYSMRAYQRRWLDARSWHYIKSRGGRPLVGRQYARARLGAPEQQDAESAPAKPNWTPDFSKVS